MHPFIFTCLLMQYASAMSIPVNTTITMIGTTVAPTDWAGIVVAMVIGVPMVLIAMFFVFIIILKDVCGGG